MSESVILKTGNVILYNYEVDGFPDCIKIDIPPNCEIEREEDQGEEDEDSDFVGNVTAKDESGEVKSARNVSVLWDAESTTLLLNTYLSMADKFSSSHYKKKELWSKVSTVLKEADYSFSPEECDRKFRNMKHTYNVIKKGMMEKEQKMTTWPYFSYLEEIFQVMNERIMQQNDPTNYTPDPELGRDHLPTAEELKCVLMGPNMHIEVPLPKDRFNCSWYFEPAYLLLSCYIVLKKEFEDRRIKKKLWWNRICNTLRHFGYYFSPEECDRKFRNLKQSFIRILRAKAKDENLVVSWEYFKYFKEIYGDDYGSDKHEESENKIYLQEYPFAEEDSNDQESIELYEPNFKRRKTDDYDSSPLWFKKYIEAQMEKNQIIENKLDTIIAEMKKASQIQEERNRILEALLNTLKS